MMSYMSRVFSPLNVPLIKPFWSLCISFGRIIFSLSDKVVGVNSTKSPKWQHLCGVVDEEED